MAIQQQDVIEITDRQVWDQFVISSPAGHPLQLWGWGEAKRNNGWTPYRLAIVQDGALVVGAQVLLWRIPKTGKAIAYVPRGPVSAPGSPKLKGLLEGISLWARAHNAIYVRIEPAWPTAALPVGWRRARAHIQLRETYVIDLHETEATMQEKMSRKHRQYIRKSEREGVTVTRESAGELGKMYEIYTETAQRANFGLHSKDYYRELSTELGGASYLYTATFEGRPIAFLWLAVAGETAYELYGGITAEGQELKANYFLKWQAIEAMKTLGLRFYDFNGRLNDGVAQFKQGFGPKEVDYIGTYDRPIRGIWYRTWETFWPIAKPVGRKLRKVVKR